MSPLIRALGSVNPLSKESTRSTTITKSRNGVEKPGAANATKIYRENQRHHRLSRMATQDHREITDIAGSPSIYRTGCEFKAGLATSYNDPLNYHSPDKGEESEDSSGSAGSDIPAVITPEIRKMRAQRTQDRFAAAQSPNVRPLRRALPQAATSCSLAQNKNSSSAHYVGQTAKINKKRVGGSTIIKLKLGTRPEEIPTSSPESVQFPQSTPITGDDTHAPSSASASDINTPQLAKLKPHLHITPVTTPSPEAIPITTPSPTPPPPTTAATTNADKLYEIDCILDTGYRILPSSHKSTRVYLIDWTGNYLPSWEPAANVSLLSLITYTTQVKRWKDFKATNKGKMLYSKRVIDKIVFEEGGKYLLTFVGNWKCEWMKKGVLVKRSDGRKLVRDWEERKIAFEGEE
ncbi:hypothetical protein ACMFMF_001715 [Clarireedia jacksonii]